MKNTFRYLLILLSVLVLCECSSGRKMINLKKTDARPGLTLPGASAADTSGQTADSIVVQDQLGNEVVLMNTTTDEETGESVATETITASVVTAKFKSVAERHGHIDLQFDIHVPDTVIDRRWRMKIVPKLYLINNKKVVFDTCYLDKVYITGERFREDQLRGYELYNKFINSIRTSDTTRFVNRFLLENYLHRFIPEIYQFKNDTSYVTREKFTTAFGGVTEQMAIIHYTNKLRMAINNFKKDITPYVYRHLVKFPFDEDGVRLDTVVMENSGEFVYTYTQSIRTRPKIKKMQLYLDGEITDNTRRLLIMPTTDSLEYNISSIVQFAHEDEERTCVRVVSRYFGADAEYGFEFEPGSTTFDPSYGHNATELAKAERDIKAMNNNWEVRLKEVDVNVGHSPEGNWVINNINSRNRAKSVTDFLKNYASGLKGGSDIAFTHSATAEDWRKLDSLVDADRSMPESSVVDYWMIRSELTPDTREEQINGKPELLAYLKEKMYPQLGKTKLTFTLERKGMTRDTMHVVDMDTTYARGVAYLMDGEYAKAVEVLRNYPDDFNAGMAFLATDRNQNALRTFESLPKTAEVNYLLAVTYSRLGNAQKAVQCLLDAVAENPSFKNRSNLDPEISRLVKRYNLFKEPEDDIIQ